MTLTRATPLTSRVICVPTIRSVTRLVPLVKVGSANVPKRRLPEAVPADQRPGVRPLIEVGFVRVGQEAAGIAPAHAALVAQSRDADLHVHSDLVVRRRWRHAVVGANVAEVDALELVVQQREAGGPGDPRATDLRRMASQRTVRAGERVLDVRTIDDGRVVTMREVKFAPAVMPVVCVVAAATSRFVALTFIAPLSAVPPMPDAAAVRSIGLTVEMPPYSATRTSTYAAGTLNVTVTAFAPAAAAGMLAA